MSGAADIIYKGIRAGMSLIGRMRLPAFFLPYQWREFREVSVHLRGCCINFRQAEAVGYGQCLAIKAGTADDEECFFGVAMLQCFLK